MDQLVKVTREELYADKSENQISDGLILRSSLAPDHFIILTNKDDGEPAIGTVDRPYYLSNQSLRSLFPDLIVILSLLKDRTSEINPSPNLTFSSQQMNNNVSVTVSLSEMSINGWMNAFIKEAFIEDFEKAKRLISKVEN